MSDNPESSKSPAGEGAEAQSAPTPSQAPKQESGGAEAAPSPGGERPAAAAPAPKPAPAGAAPAASKPAPAKPAPAPPSEPDPQLIRGMRDKVVAVLEEKKRVGEPVTVTSQHKEISLTGRVVRIEPEEGFVVVEHVDGRRRGIYYILGGSLKTQDGQEVPFPVDGVPR